MTKETAEELLGKCFKQVEMELMFPTIFSIATGDQKRRMEHNWKDFKEATTEKVIDLIEEAREEEREKHVKVIINDPNGYIRQHELQEARREAETKTADELHTEFLKICVGLESGKDITKRGAKYFIKKAEEIKNCFLGGEEK